MERFHPRRSSFTPISSRRSHTLSREGNRLVRKQRNFPKLASDSSSQSGDSTDEDLFTCELRLRSSKQAVGTPIKKLLAEEMSRESESKRRSPSVIARLMGLDGLPQQPSSHKQQKKSSENYPQRMTGAEKVQRNSTSYGRRSLRKGSKEEQEFKDVFEVLDKSKVDSSGSSLRGSSNLKPTEAEMAFIQQEWHSSPGSANLKPTEAEMAFIQKKFMDAKRLSTDEKLQNSKEFHDAIEDLNSNKDLLLKYLQQPDSLFIKHMHDLQGVPPQSHCGWTRMSAVKPSHPPQSGSSGLGCNIERETSSKNRGKLLVNPASHSYSKHEAQNPVKLSKIQLEQKHEPAILPTRIVVLKPNLGKMQSSTNKTPSPHSSHVSRSDCRKETKVCSIKNREAVSCGKKRFADGAGPSRYKSRESREIAKEITRQMRKSFSNGSMNFSNHGLRGYAGDESSSNLSENESANESEATVTSRNSIDCSKQCRPSLSCSTQSSVSREAKKRLSERWKMTHKSVDMGIVCRSSTLGEMLAISDSETRPAISDAMICRKPFMDNFDCDDGTIRGDEPLGISSREGWKDVGVGNLLRSRSVPASSTVISRPTTGYGHENVFHDRYMVPKQVIHQEKNRPIKGNFNKREYSPSRSSRSRTRKSNMSKSSHRDSSDSSLEIIFGLDKVQSKVEDVDPLEQNSTVSELSASVVIDSGLVLENAVDVATENTAKTSKPVDQEYLTYMLVKGDSSTGDQELSSSQVPSNGSFEKGSIAIQSPVTNIASPANSKEADQPSPVSILETPFPDDLSSGSECFESLSADLHGLRMQLQLLKLETESYAEGPMLISSDEDTEEGPVGPTEERQVAEESRELSYIVKAMLGSGINDADPDTFLAMLNSPECPVSPSIFEELEKKYCNYASWPRSERKLLFDRLNLALQMVYQKSTDSHPWVRPATLTGSKWIKNGLEDCLRKLLASHDKKAANKDVMAEKIFASEAEWLDLREDVGVIGREIERLLTEELVIELVAI